MDNFDSSTFAAGVGDSSFEDWLSNSGNSQSVAILIDLSGTTIRCGKTNVMDDTPSHSFRRIYNNCDDDNLGVDENTNNDDIKYSEQVKLNISKALELMNINLENLESILIIDSPLDHTDDLKRREIICRVLFEHFKVAHVSIQDAAYMSLVASGVELMSGLVLHVGESSSYVAAVVDGQVRIDSLCVGNVSGKDLTLELKSSLQKHFEGRFDTTVFTDTIVNRLKVKYVSAMFEQFPLYESFNVTDNVTINIGECKEEFKRVSNMLFSSESSIQQLVKQCIAKINDDSIDLSNNIILSGGSTMMHDFIERLTKELTPQINEVTFNELASRCSNRASLRFMGANILTSVPEWITPYCVNKEDFEQDGPSCIVEKRSWDVMYSSPFGDDQFGF